MAIIILQKLLEKMREVDKTLALRERPQDWERGLKLAVRLVISSQMSVMHYKDLERDCGMSLHQ